MTAAMSALLAAADLTLPALGGLVALAFYGGVRVGEALHLRSETADRRSPELQQFEARLRLRRERISHLNRATTARHTMSTP